MPTCSDLEVLVSASPSGWFRPQPRRTAGVSFLNLGGLANAATSAAGALGGAVGGMAGAGQSKLLPEPKVPQLNMGPMFLGLGTLPRM